MPGDVVLLPTGIAHSLASAPGAGTVPFDHPAAERALATGESLRLGTDPVAGPALAVLHTQPGRDWTIPALAAAIGVSRATLARRFPAQVGCTPAAYLTRWRMDLAAVRLRDTDDTVGTVARSLGYTSEYAFNGAFTRDRRIPPGRYRTQSRTTRPQA